MAPYKPPTNAQTRDRVAAIAAVTEFRTRAGQIVTPGPLRPESTLAVYSKLVADGTYTAHQHVAAAYDDGTPATATGEALARWGTVVGVTKRPATFAKGPVAFTGTPGSLIPAETQIVHVASGLTYRTDALGSIDVTGNGSGTVTAELDGPDSNLADGTALQLVQPVAGVDQAVTASEDIAGGAEAEADEDLRARIVDEAATRPNDGNAATYVSNARRAPGITRAWAAGDLGSAGDVLLYVVADGQSPITPTGTQIVAVEAEMDPPVGTTVHVFAPGLVALDPLIAIKPDTTTIRQNVTASLAAMLEEVTEPGKTIPLSKIRQATSNAVGIEDYLLTSPTADVTVQVGEIVVVGIPIYGTLP